MNLNQCIYKGVYFLIDESDLPHEYKGFQLARQ
jgi:hypothetical protein